MCQLSMQVNAIFNFEDKSLIFVCVSLVFKRYPRALEVLQQMD